MRPNVILGLVSIAITLLGTSDAEHCTTYSTSQPEVTVGDGGSGTYYIDNDLCQPECLSSIWFYYESNDIDGLQRGDRVVDDTCHHMIESDNFP